MRRAIYALATCCVASGSLAETAAHRFRLWDGERVQRFETSPRMIARCVGMTDALIEDDVGGLLIIEQQKAGTRDEIMAVASSGEDISHRSAGRADRLEAPTRTELDGERALGKARFHGADEFIAMDPFSEQSINFMQSMHICANVYLTLQYYMQAEHGI